MQEEKICLREYPGIGAWNKTVISLVRYDKAGTIKSEFLGGGWRENFKPIILSASFVTGRKFIYPSTTEDKIEGNSEFTVLRPFPQLWAENQREKVLITGDSEMISKYWDRGYEVLKVLEVEKFKYENNNNNVITTILNTWHMEQKIESFGDLSTPGLDKNLLPPEKYPGLYVHIAKEVMLPTIMVAGETGCYSNPVFDDAPE